MTGMTGSRNILLRVSHTKQARIIFFILFMIFQTGTVFSLTEDTDDSSRLILLAEDSFVKGLEMEEEKKGAGREEFLKSAGIYQTLIEERGIVNGKIFYNQGNSWLSAGETGRAILSYQRALRFTPGDSSLKNNLRQAREKITNRAAPDSKNEIKHILFFFHYDIPGRIKNTVLLLTFLAFWTLMIISLYRPGIRRFAPIPLVFALIFGSSLLVEILQEKTHPEIVLTADETVARKGDAESYSPAFDAPLGGGTWGRRIQDAGEWWLIRLENGDECWVPSSAAEQVGIF